MSSTDLAVDTFTLVIIDPYYGATVIRWGDQVLGRSIGVDSKGWTCRNGVLTP